MSFTTGIGSSITRLRFVSIALVAQGCLASHPARQAAVANAPTTIVVVRHAEKSTDDPQDPSLSSAGHERARELSTVLKDGRVGAIYTTQYKRTRQTAEPLASQFGIEILERPATAGNASTYAADLAREVLARNNGMTVLIVGHSNTVPLIVRAFGGLTIQPITDREYDHLFVVVVSGDRPPRLLNLRFGRPTP